MQDVDDELRSHRIGSPERDPRRGLGRRLRELFSASATDSDSDDDGEADYVELSWGTTLTNPDTDGDGIRDGDELSARTDPLVAGHAFTTPIDVVRIGNGVSGLGDFWLLANSNLLAFPNGTLYVTIALQDTTATRINDASSFFVNTSLAGWDTPDIGILIADYAATPTPRRLLARGRMTSIPEPDLAIGIACAAMLLGAAGRLLARRAHA